jgi:hypothetical protein
MSPRVSTLISFPRLGIGLSAVLCSVGIAACGGGDDDTFFGRGTTEVREISLDEDVINRGEGTVMRVNFSFDENEVLFDERNVSLVVKLPAGLAFREDSSEIDGPGSNDEGVEPQIFQCRSGETYLLFDMDRFDLDNASAPDDGADAQMKLTVDGIAAGANLVIEARADEGRISFGCGTMFIPDEQALITVR